ncbi:MAG TPA: peptidyl-prolyl cis-trans isomerase [Chromatiaceae bacterium]|jgi:peptidyl-prolyl cis-trans isomerase B (cyclophilin B)|nr:MAG: cyclophilin [Thiohalocapsa sp. PB-PSB1]QQO53844.1 MAG: peptidyl-prolyl cis-trans isomerase [Thiohalocapsa sp. PB-PSB1]HBG95306.1 peptidyl-prolyl cis-trans isomerase [Chromatiaceae bacterium]HCS88892.1 peptidyl-prolyl cis-trans isomerase [Chromatiaceae bacterium]
MIKLTTNLGVINIQLDHEKAPITCANFEQYVRDGHYDNTLFHRVINGFMIQGGGMNTDFVQKPTRATIENEAKNGLKNVVGSVAMARTMDPHSASSQFFINVSDNSFLDYPGQDGWGYCVFGMVTDGMDVVNAIKEVKTGSRQGHQDVPITDVILEKAEIVD